MANAFDDPRRRIRATCDVIGCGLGAHESQQT